MPSWYRAEINPERYALERFTRRIARTAGRVGVIPVDEEETVQAEDGMWGSDVDSGEEWKPSDWGR